MAPGAAAKFGDSRAADDLLTKYPLIVVVAVIAMALCCAATGLTFALRSPAAPLAAFGVGILTGAEATAGFFLVSKTYRTRRSSL